MTDSITNRFLTLCQVPLTLLILGFVQGEQLTLGLLLVVWALTFRKLDVEELGLVLFTALLFIIVNYLALSQNMFAFSNKHLIKLPLYEFFLWPFYVLHAKRLFGGSQAGLPDWKTLALFALYVLAFIFSPSTTILLCAAGALLLLGIALYRSHKDIAYTVYLILFAAAVEYTGVHQGHWSYPGNPPGGVPLWFFALWGGTGFFLHRAALPLIERVTRHAKGT